MEAARGLGLAARFVSGYLNSPPSALDFGATHAWAEVFLPGAGWKGFDPTLGKIVGADHIAVAVTRLPESVPPVAGTFVGPSGASLDVGVWVTPLAPN
jgi:transglutaminase-like putative cysteine protease